ncbi:lysM domain-containing GPI-anchored protein 2-like [Nymphaea colorata]|nr:lysM domain-containing GPI-anchored protein 2-like [Nymphaea colorata]
MNPTPFLLFLLLLGTSTISSVAALGFKCSGTATKCQALVGYTPKNASTLSAIASLFGLKSHSSLLGPNALPLNTSKHHKITAGQAVRVPISCSCGNGRGYSDRSPVYVVKHGDFLDHIARDVFSELLNYSSIATVNNIPDPNQIQGGQKLWIPLPCSCDQGETFPIEHYAHVVAKGTDLTGIAAQFGTTQAKLMTLNDISDATTLQAGQVLDVPLRVCSSAIQNTSLDSSLAVANGSYAFTAKNCVLCKCSSASWQLDCAPNTLGNLTCPSMECSSTGMTMGNRSTVTSCQENVCSYAGYTNNNTILTTMISQSTCPVSPASSPSESSPASAVMGRVKGARWGWPLMLGLLASVLLIHA